MDNGKAFTDRLFGLRKRAATGAHEFDMLCAAPDIEHRLTPPKSPQTNGMVPSHGLKANHCPLPGRACLHAREGGNGAVQRPDRGGPAKPPLPIRRRTGDDTAPLCLALQPAASTISLGQQNALAGDEDLAQTQTGVVQEAAILPDGM